MTHRYEDSSILHMSLDDGRCNQCKYINNNGATCKAFPGGIPEEILRGQHKHERPYKGDNGIRFEPIKE